MLKVAETILQACVVYAVVSLITGPTVLMEFVYYATSAEAWYAPARDVAASAAGPIVTFAAAAAGGVYLFSLFLLGSFTRLISSAQDISFDMKVALRGRRAIVARVLADAGIKPVKKPHGAGSLRSLIASAAGLPVSQVVLAPLANIPEGFGHRSLISRTRVFTRQALVFSEPSGPLRLELARSLARVQALAADEVDNPGSQSFTDCLGRAQMLSRLLAEADEAPLDN